MLPLFGGVLCLVLVLLFSTLCSSRMGERERERESWLLYFNCLSDALLQLVFCGSSSEDWVGLQCVIVGYPDHTHFERVMLSHIKLSVFVD